MPDTTTTLELSTTTGVESAPSSVSPTSPTPTETPVTPTPATSATPVATTTSPPTDPPTTADPAAATREEIEAAVDLAQETFSACLVAMPNCDPSILEVARAGALLERNVARIEEWNAAGYTVRNRDRFRYVIEEISINSSGVQAAVLVCIADDSDLVQPGAGPGGADVVIDDSFTSGRASWDMRLDPDGVWRAHDAPAVGPTEATDVCPAA